MHNELLSIFPSMHGSHVHCLGMLALAIQSVKALVLIDCDMITLLTENDTALMVAIEICIACGMRRPMPA